MHFFLSKKLLWIFPIFFYSIYVFVKLFLKIFSLTSYCALVTGRAEKETTIDCLLLCVLAIGSNLLFHLKERKKLYADYILSEMVTLKAA